MKRDGGPAFPQTMTVDPNGGFTCGWDGHGVGGMTLRDYFAAHAPAPTQQWMDDSRNDGHHVLNSDAAWRYAYADAMLAERDKS